MLPTLNRHWVATNPIDALWNARREMDRMFSGLGYTGTAEGAPFTIPAEVVETDNEMRFLFEFPGMRAEDINVTVENNVLTVAGERKYEREEGGEQGEVHLFERRYGRFERSFTLPRRVDTGKVDASYDNGVLTVTLPKSEAAKPRRIEVSAASGARRIGSK